MLLSMRRTGEPDAKRVKYESAGSESGEGEVDDAILQRFSVCTVDSSKPSKKRAYVRQLGVTEAEYVDISQVQQLLFESAAASGKPASDRNRRADSHDQIDRQDRDQGRKPVTPQRVAPPVRPHSQPSCSAELLRQGRQLEYFSKGESPKVVQCMLPPLQPPTTPASPVTPITPITPLLHTPPFSAGGHSPNVEELFALWFGVPPGNAGEETTVILYSTII